MAIVSALIIPRSATIQKRLMPKRCLNLSTTGSKLFTSAVLPGHISQQIGRPLSSRIAPTSVCFRYGLWSLLCPNFPRISVRRALIQWHENHIFVTFSAEPGAACKLLVLIFVHFSTRTAKILPGKPNLIVVTSRALLNHLRFFGK